MAQVRYTAEVRTGRLLELPIEAGELHLKPGDKIDVQLAVLRRRPRRSTPIRRLP